MSAQEISIEKQREELKKKEMENKILQQKLKQKQQEPLPYTQVPQQNLPQINANDLRPSHISIKTPDNVKEILSRIHNIPPSTIKSNLDTQEDSTSNNDRLVSDNTISDSKKGKKKTGIKIF